MRFLIECTYVYDHPSDNSGIQRVVRNIVSRLGRIQDIAHAIPVILKNNKIYEVKKLTPESDIMRLANRLHYRLIRARERYWSYCPRIGNLQLFHASLNMRRILSLLFKVLGLPFDLSILMVSYLCQKGEIGKRILEVTINKDDVLVLLDSSWHSDFLEQVEGLKRKGITIVSVFYDLIPLTHPRFCDEGLVVVFERWFQWISRTADGFISISKTIRDQVKSYVLNGNEGTKKENNQWFEYFYLGNELDLALKNGIIRKKIKKIFENDSPVYLMVGTIEPRKNHVYLLHAFDMLWHRNLNVNLCFIGKVGWKCDALIERVHAHVEYNRRLFMFNDLNDTELEYCYRKSRSLVFPAYVEGFGLPLVEAMQRGLPVMASDIPVFHEVGGDYIAYFALDRPETLMELILHYEASGKFPAIKKLEEWSWLNWEDSARQFLSKIVSHISPNHVGEHTLHKNI